MKASIWKWLILVAVAAGCVYLIAPAASKRIVRQIWAELRPVRLAGPEEQAAAAEKEKRAAARVQPVPPPPAQDVELPFYYEKLEEGAPPAAECDADRCLRLQRDGQAAFLYGDYARALASWEEWQTAQPGDPQASMLVGDAYQRLGDLEQAEKNYTRSLEADPGQVALAMRRASLLGKLGRAPEAVAALNRYARLFPDDGRVLQAQADWLWRDNRASEAIPLVKRVLELDPGNLGARALLLRMPISEEEFDVQLDQLLAFGSSPDRRYELGQLIWSLDLLSYPRTYALAQWVGSPAEPGQEEPRVAALFNSLKPRTEPVEDLCEGGKLSEAWMIRNGSFLPQNGGGGLQSDPLHTEAYLRLLGSEQLQDAFVEASVQNIEGGVWLYLRRTDDHFIRFGFEGGLLHLQIWNHGQIVAAQKKPWTLREGQAQLRLEIHGDGAMGHVDGEPAFTTPVRIPSGYGLGWAGVAIFHSERGQAQVLIVRISAGPVWPRMVMVPPLQRDADVDAVLARVRPDLLALTDFAPQWYQVGSDGEWTDQSGTGRNMLELFARCAQLRLLPAVEVSSPNAITASRLVAEATERNHEGFVLLFKKMPEPTWMDSIRKALVRSDLDVMAITMDAATGSGKMAALGGGRVVSMAPRDGADFQMVPWDDPNGVRRPVAAMPGNKPLVLTLDVPGPEDDQAGEGASLPQNEMPVEKPAP